MLFILGVFSALCVALAIDPHYMVEVFRGRVNFLRCFLKSGILIVVHNMWDFAERLKTRLIWMLGLHKVFPTFLLLALVAALPVLAHKWLFHNDDIVNRDAFPNSTIALNALEMEFVFTVLSHVLCVYLNSCRARFGQNPNHQSCITNTVIFLCLFALVLTVLVLMESGTEYARLRWEVLQECEVSKHNGGHDQNCYFHPITLPSKDSIGHTLIGQCQMALWLVSLLNLPWFQLYGEPNPEATSSQRKRIQRKGATRHGSASKAKAPHANGNQSTLSRRKRSRSVTH